MSRNTSRQPRQTQNKSRSGSLKRIAVIPAIAVVCILSLWGAKSLFHSLSSGPQAKPSAFPERLIEDSKAPPMLAAERETSVLKKAETEIIEAVTREFPNHEAALKLMGDYHSRHGKGTEAMKFWQRCLELNPGRADVHGDMGDIAMERGEFEMAVEHFNHALVIEPKANGWRDKKGRALVELGRFDEAIRELQEAGDATPKSFMAHFLLGQAYLKRKQYERARDSLQLALDIDPESGNACYGLARVFAALKQPAKAREYLLKFKSLENSKAEDDRALNTGASLYTRDLAALRRAVVQTHLDAERLYLEEKDIGKAEELLNRAIEFDPKNTTCYERLGALYSMTDRLSEAVRQFERISEIKPSGIRAYLNIGRLSIRLKKHAAAEAAYNRAVSIAPQQAVGYRELSRLYLMSNTKPVEARKFAEKALSLEPSAESFFILSWACDLNGDRSGAVRAIQKAIELEPNNSRYRRTYEGIQSAN